MLAWHEALSDVDFAAALVAVSRHYAEHTERLMPAHVRRLAAEIGRERRRAERERRETAERLALEAHPRTDRGEELRDAVRAMLPAGDPDKLRWGHKRWRELIHEAKRQREAQPNPHYDPTVHARLAAEGLE